MSIHGTAVAEEHGIARSSHWHTVEKHFLVANARCVMCTDEQHAARLAQLDRNAITRGLQVHHADIPFHYAIGVGRFDLELDPRNLKVFCEDEPGVKTEDHHNLAGHLRIFRSYNPDLENFIKRFFGWSKERLLNDKGFLALCAKLPPTWGELDTKARQALRKNLDQKFPPDKKLLEFYGITLKACA